MQQTMIPQSPIAQPAASSKATRVDYHTTPADFAQEVEEIKAALRGLITLLSLMRSDNRLGLPNGATVGRSDVRSLFSAIMHHFDNLPKRFRASYGKKSTATGARGRGGQLRHPFYVSNQLVRYILNANKGNGLAVLAPVLLAMKVPIQDVIQFVNINGQAEGAVDAVRQWFALRNTSFEAIAAAAAAPPFNIAGLSLGNININGVLAGLLAESHIAISGILVSLMHLISTVSDLQSKTNGQRVHTDALWEAVFGDGTNTRWVIGDSDYSAAIEAAVRAGTSEALIALGARTAEHQTALRVHAENCNKSAKARIAERPPVQLNRKGPNGQTIKKSYPTYISQAQAAQFGNADDYGVLYSMFMTLISYGRIPTFIFGSFPQMQAALRPVPVKKQALAEDGVTVVEKEEETNQNILTATAVSQYLQSILGAHSVLHKPERDSRREANQKAQRQAEKAAKKAQAAALQQGAVATTGLPVVALPSALPFAAVSSLPAGTTTISGLPLPGLPH